MLHCDRVWTGVRNRDKPAGRCAAARGCDSRLAALIPVRCGAGAAAARAAWSALRSSRSRCPGTSSQGQTGRAPPAAVRKEGGKRAAGGRDVPTSRAAQSGRMQPLGCKPRGLAAQERRLLASHQQVGTAELHASPLNRLNGSDTRMHGRTHPMLTTSGSAPSSSAFLHTALPMCLCLQQQQQHGQRLSSGMLEPSATSAAPATSTR